MVGLYYFAFFFSSSRTNAGTWKKTQLIYTSSVGIQKSGGICIFNVWYYQGSMYNSQIFFLSGCQERGDRGREGYMVMRAVFDIIAKVPV